MGYLAYKCNQNTNRNPTVFCKLCGVAFRLDRKTYHQKAFHKLLTKDTIVINIIKEGEEPVDPVMDNWKEYALQYGRVKAEYVKNVDSKRGFTLSRKASASC